jgi:putative acetyltransferase
VQAGLTIREEQPADRASVLSVIERAFVAEPEVVGLWSALAQRPGTLGLVAVEAGDVVGHAGLSWGWVDAPERLVDVLVLSPVSVAPEHQRQGVGRRLVERAISASADLGAAALFLEGDPGYYARYGFAPGRDHGFTAPSARIPWAAFQCVLLPAYDETVVGALVYPDTFWAHDAVGLRGERLAAVLRAIGEDPGAHGQQAPNA